MLSENVAKIAKTFICDKCNYKCSKRSDYKKHTLTAKHKLLSNAISKTAEVAKPCVCACGKEYKHKPSYYRHKGVCVYKDDDILSNSIINNDTNNTIMGLIMQNKELMNLLITKNHQTDELIQQNKEMQKTMKDIIPKIGNNNNNTSNSNNQFNLQVFLNEDCKDALNFSEFLAQIQVSFEDLENQAENGYIKGISRLFIESLQELGQNKRPIHCSDKKRKTIYIKENDEWDKEGSLELLKKGINEVTKRTVQTLMREKENNAEEYKDMDSEFSVKCLDIQRNLFPTTDRDATIGKVIEKITQSSGIVDKVL